METMTVTSQVFATAEQAAANISGAPLSIAKGKTARMAKVDVHEVGEGFRAVGIVEINEMEAAEEDEGKTGGTASAGGGQEAKKDGLILLPRRQGLPQQTMPSSESLKEIHAEPEQFTPHQESPETLQDGTQDSSFEPSPPQEMQTGPETLTEDANDLTEKLQTDFEQAENPDSAEYGHIPPVPDDSLQHVQASDGTVLSVSPDPHIAAGEIAEYEQALQERRLAHESNDGPPAEPV